MKMYRFDKRAHSFHIYQMSSDEDFFYIHPNSLILGMLFATVCMLFLLILGLWIATKLR